MTLRLESSKNIDGILEKLSSLGYEVSTINSNCGFAYRKGSNSSDFRSDIKSAKLSCKFTSSIKVEYGSSSASL